MEGMSHNDHDCVLSISFCRYRTVAAVATTMTTAAAAISLSSISLCGLLAYRGRRWFLVFDKINMFILALIVHIKIHFLDHKMRGHAFMRRYKYMGHHIISYHIVSYSCKSINCRWIIHFVLCCMGKAYSPRNVFGIIQRSAIVRVLDRL